MSAPLTLCRLSSSEGGFVASKEHTRPSTEAVNNVSGLLVWKRTFRMNTNTGPASYKLQRAHMTGQKFSKHIHLMYAPSPTIAHCFLVLCFPKCA